MIKHITAFIVLILTYICLTILTIYGALAFLSLFLGPILFIFSHFHHNVGHPIIYLVLTIISLFTLYIEQGVCNDDEFLLPWIKYPVLWFNKLCILSYTLRAYPYKLRNKEYKKVDKQKNRGRYD